MHSPGVPEKPWRVALTGSSGMIGSALATSLEREGHAVLRLVRGDAGPGEAYWNPDSGELDARALEGVNVVVNLAGENVGQRWTPAVMKRIRSSRVDGTRLLARALASLNAPPDVLVNASAVGYYGDRGDEVLTESSAPGEDFLASVVRDWEGATSAAAEAGIRVACLRFGLVLSASGGALARMLPVFRAGGGGRLGSGRQWMSWISLDDLVDVVRHVIGSAEARDAINVVAPTPVTNEEFTRTLGEVLRRPTLFAAPTPLLHLVFGDMAEATLLASQRALPERLERGGFTFRHPGLADALRAALATSG